MHANDILDLKEPLQSLYVYNGLYETQITKRGFESTFLNKFRLVFHCSNTKLNLNELNDE